MYRYVRLGKRFDLVVEAERWLERYRTRPGLHVGFGVDTRGIACELNVSTGRAEWGGSIDIGICERWEE